MADSARTVTIVSGDAFASPYVCVAFGLPGTTNPTSLTFDGNIQPIGGSLLTISGTPLTAPAIPGTGSTYWIVQVNTSTGAASIKSSPSSFPAPDASNITVAQQQLQFTDTSIASAALGFSTIDQW